MSAKRMTDVKLDTVTTRIPAALNVKITAEAFMRNTTRAEIVRMAIEAYINNRQPKQSEVKP